SAHLRRYRLPYGLAGAAVLLALLFLPLPRHVDAGYVLRPDRVMVFRAPEEGVLDSVFAEEGDTVARGAAVVAFRSRDVDVDRAQAASGLEAARARLAEAVSRGDAVMSAGFLGDVRAGEVASAASDTRAARARAVAPYRAVLLGPRME